MLRLQGLPSWVGTLTVVLVAGCGGGGGGSGGTLQPQIAPATPPQGVAGVPYKTFTFTVASGGLAPFTFSETGALPAGMSLSSSGQLSGTPATAGTYPITVKVTDSSTPPLTAASQVNMVIQDSPIVVATVPAPPAGARLNRYPGYTFAVASGGSPGGGFTWAVTAGDLPDGLMLAINGDLGGTPTKNGSFLFTVTATDLAKPARKGSAQFSIMVSNPPPPIVCCRLPPTGTVGTVYSPFQFTALDGLPPLAWSATGSMPGLVLSASGGLSGTPTMAGRFPITVKATDALSQTSPDTPFTVRVSLARPAAGFTPTGSMKFARFQHSATLLADGKVLVAGGGQAVGGIPYSAAEIYDPITGAFTDAMGPMTQPRAGHTATLLNDGTGRVLIAGGSAMSAAELYNPATGTFAATTGSLINARLTTTATLLQSGKVLIAGGNTPTSEAITAAELYDPATGKFTATRGALNFARSGHTATLLQSGKVLIAGGITSSSSATDTAELYDPVSDTFTATGKMSAQRTGHTATRLQDGGVLVIGTEGTPIEVTADLYDPSSGTFAAVGNLPAAGARTASLRSDGTVVVAGGVIIGETRGPDGLGGCKNLFFPVSLADAQLFAPESQGFTATGSLNVPRDGHTATVLADGTVLIVGGVSHSIIGSSAPNNCTGAGASAVLSSAELFN